MDNIRPILKIVTESFGRLSWKDYDSAALAIARHIANEESLNKTVDAVPKNFQVLNRISKKQLTQEINAISEKALVSKSTLPERTRTRVLMLTASPSPEDTDPIRVDKEYHHIKKRVLSTVDRDRFEFEILPAAEPDDIMDTLNRFNPSILHISSHGNNESLLLEGEDGYGLFLNYEQFNMMVASMENAVRVVILNACLSAKAAKLLAAESSVDFAIGMDNTVGDRAASDFAQQFYSSLGNGRSVFSAFTQAKISISIHTDDEIDKKNPQLFSRKGCDPKTTFLKDL